MTQCLSEQAMMLLLEGEGTPVERRHLESCPHCGNEFRALQQDIQQIRTVLQTVTIPQRQDHALHPFSRGWLEMAAAIVAVGVFVLSAQVWWSQRHETIQMVSSSGQPTNHSGPDSTTALLEQISPLLFSDSDISAEAYPQGLSDGPKAARLVAGDGDDLLVCLPQDDSMLCMNASEDKS